MTTEPNTTIQPSEKFMNALNELKPIWLDLKNNRSNMEQIGEQYRNLIVLGKSEGLSFRFVDYKLNEITTNCEECSQQIIIDRRNERLCLSCNEKKQRQEWLEECEEARRKEDPIEKYCHKIRGTIPSYEEPFEFRPDFEDFEDFGEEYKRIMSGDTKNEREEAQRKEWTRRKEEQYYKDIKNKPEGMTKAQWIKEGSKRRKLEREENKQYQLDSKLRYRNSPIRMLEDRIGKIGCKCEAEGMRQGVFCETCGLLVKVNEYMLSLFKDASEGRSTVI